MRDSVRRYKETFMRSRAFGHENFVGWPPESFVYTRLAELDAVITGLDSYSTAQVAGLDAAWQGALGKRVARAKLMRTLAAIGRTARLLAESDPTLLQRFRVPYSQSDQGVLAAAAAFAAGARQLKAEFIRLGLRDDFIEVLEANTDALREAVARSIENRRTHVTATAAIAELVVRGLKALRELDLFMRNTYGDVPEKLAAWRSASRVERRNRRPRAVAPPPAPPTSPTPDTPAPAPAG